jgi:hypothetical protein
MQWDSDRLVERLFASDVADAAAVLAAEAGVVLSTEPLTRANANAEFRAFETALADASVAAPPPALAPTLVRRRGGSVQDVFEPFGYNFGVRFCSELLVEFNDDAGAVLDLLKSKQFGAIPNSILEFVSTDNEDFEPLSNRVHRDYATPYRERLSTVTEEEKVARAFREAQALHGHKVFRAAPPLLSTETSFESAGAADTSTLDSSGTRALIESALLAIRDIEIGERDDVDDDDDDDDADGDAKQRKSKAAPQVQVMHQSITLSEYGVLLSDESSSGSCETSPLPALPPPLPPREEEIECSICFSDVPMSSSFALSCAHRFCTDCWSSHLAAHLSQGKVVAHCMHAGCKVGLSPLDWRLLADAASFKRYRHLGLQNFVACSPVAVFCPNPRGCARVIFWPRVAHSTDRTVVCQCGWRFCWRCKEEAHMPVSCDNMREFKSESGDAANAKWIVQHTKPCPNCHKSIEKNEGCMHMHCSQCSYDFCWICLRKYENHANFYSCSFEPPKTAPKHEDMMVNVLEKYEFHKNAKESVKLRQLVCEVIAYRLQRESLPGHAIVDALGPIMNCHDLLSAGEVYRLGVEQPVHAQLLQELLHNLRIHTDQLWTRVLAATSQGARKKPVQVQATELHALHAIASVVERHRLALCEALEVGAAFEGASSKFPKAKPMAMPAKERAALMAKNKSSATTALTAKPLVMLRRLRATDGFYRSRTDVVVSAPIFGGGDAHVGGGPPRWNVSDSLTETESEYEYENDNDLEIS